LVSVKLVCIDVFFLDVVIQRIAFGKVCHHNSTGFVIRFSGFVQHTFLLMHNALYGRQNLSVSIFVYSEHLVTRLVSEHEHHIVIVLL